MKILSLNEIPEVGREADYLCAIVEQNHDRLYSKNPNLDVDIGGKHFHCISSDKNIIYRVQGERSWYLKFSVNKKWIRHEIAGAHAVNTMLAGCQAYQHADAIRVSMEQRYTLYSAVEGKSFNRYLLEGCFSGFGRLPRSTISVMKSLGKVIGTLHSYGEPTGLTVLSPSNLSYLLDYLEKIDDSTNTIKRVADWVNKQETERESSAWIHGNIKSEDIFIAGEKISLIDFGTCGMGIPYEDLSNLCAFMLLLKSVPFFPWRKAREAMNALLEGYGSAFHYDKPELRRYITQGVMRYYLKNIVLHKGIASLNRMPVLRSRVDELVLQLLDGHYTQSFEGIDQKQL